MGTPGKSCYKHVEAPVGSAKQVFCQCWGTELIRALRQAAETCVQDRTEEQVELLSRGPTGTNARKALMHCASATDGVRHFHQECLNSSNDRKRAPGLASNNSILRVPAKGAAEPLPEDTQELQDLRHHLCEECLLSLEGSLDVHGSHASGKPASHPPRTPLSGT